MTAELSSEAFLPSGAVDPSSMPLPNGHAHGHAQHTNGAALSPQSHQFNNPEPGRASHWLLTQDASPNLMASQRAPNLSFAQNGDTTAAHSHRAGAFSPNRSGFISDHLFPPSSTGHTHMPISPIGRSVSADAAGPSATSIHMIQRLVQQNTLIRDAWEAERNYLEANRRRAEEVYQEERAIMEDVREGWEIEKANLLREIEGLKERVYRLEGENSTLKTVTSQVAGMMSPLASQRGGSGDASADTSYFSPPIAAQPNGRNQSSPPAVLSQAGTSSLPPGLDGASRRPHFLPGSSRVSPTTQPDSSPFIPLDPRMQPQHPTKDFLSSPSEESETPVPVIDVKEIDPTLEGISIKATAVQKSTFCRAASPPAETTAPPAVTSPPFASQRERKHPSATGARLTKVCTIQALAAAESKRLTLHAGHTPNHSLSLFPTVTGTETSSTIGQSDGATPTTEQSLQLAEHTGEAGLDGDGRRESDGMVSEHGLDDPEPMLDPLDDAPLKGPLMIRNMPAQDEIFWEAVNKKLEPISQGQNALPAVMQPSPERSPQQRTLVEPAQASAKPPGGDGPNDSATEVDEDDDEAGSSGHKKTKSLEADVPLKLRSTTNFGAPFGIA